MPVYRFFAKGCEVEAVAIVVAKTATRARALAKEALGKEAGKGLTPCTTYDADEEEEVVYYDQGRLDVTWGGNVSET